MRFLLCVLAGAILASACVGPSPKSIRPMSISPTEFAGFSCDELRNTQMLDWKRKEDLRIPLKRASEDIPLLGGTDYHAQIEREYAEKLGRLNAIEMAAFKNDCQTATVDELKALYSLDGSTKPSWPSKG